MAKVEQRHRDEAARVWNLIVAGAGLDTLAQALADAQSAPPDGAGGWVALEALLYWLRTERRRTHEAADNADHEEQRMCLLNQALALRGVIELLEDGKVLPPPPATDAKGQE